MCGVKIGNIRRQRKCLIERRWISCTRVYSWPRVTLVFATETFGSTSDAFTI